MTNGFDGLGELAVVKNALGSTTNYFDNLGRLTDVWNTNGQVQASVYDLDDRRTSQTDANGVVLSSTYDNLGRLRTRTAPDSGLEAYGYTANYSAPTSYTNQLSKVWQYSYDPFGRKTNEVAVSVYTNSFTYSPASDLLTLSDGKSQVTRWVYDAYGRVTSKTNQASTEILDYQYDAASQLTNRWSAARGNTKYKYDAVGSLTNVDYPASPDLTYKYDALNRLTNMVDVAGTSSFTYNGAGKLLTEVSPWATDTVTYTYNTAGLRASMSIQQPTGSFTNGYKYDGGMRLTNLTSTAGSFSYYYHPGVDGGMDATRLVRRLSLPNTSYITNFYDSSGRMTETDLKNSSGTILNEHAYIYDAANQRIKQTRTDLSYATYTYDPVGELQSARGTNSGGTVIFTEQMGYKYDAALNLNTRTNAGVNSTFATDSRNQLSNGSSYIYDGNGNMTYSLPASTGHNFTYDDENQLLSVEVPATFYSTFTYDGLGRRRTRSDYTWNGSTWISPATTDYIYDGMLVVQERTAAPTVTYTRGPDLSGSFQGAGGIGGMLARSSGYSGGAWSTHSFYHADGNGNITMLLNSSQTAVASYRYDPYGNTLASSGTLATANTYRFSSKEVHTGYTDSGLYYYGYRWYDPNLQRWLNQDPIQEVGGINLYGFVGNRSPNFVDSNGTSIAIALPILEVSIGLGLAWWVGHELAKHPPTWNTTDDEPAYTPSNRDRNRAKAPKKQGGKECPPERDSTGKRERDKEDFHDEKKHEGRGPADHYGGEGRRSAGIGATQ